MARTRILLADDHPQFLADVESLLNDRYDIVGAVQDGAELVSAARRLQPDLIVSDISMPRLSGLDALIQIRALSLKPKFIFLTVQASPAYIREARSVGANGYVIKSQATEQLPLALSSVLAGESFFPATDRPAV